MSNDRPIGNLTIEELRKDFSAACYDLDTINVEGITGRNAWSIVFIKRRIEELKRAIDVHDKKVIEMGEI